MAPSKALKNALYVAVFSGVFKLTGNAEMICWAICMAGRQSESEFDLKE